MIDSVVNSNVALPLSGLLEAKMPRTSSTGRMGRPPAALWD
jgi:hypothetical protein